MNTTTFPANPRRRRPARAAIPLLVLVLTFASGCDGLGSASEAEYLERAEQHMQSEDYSAAIIEYRNAMRLEDRPETRAALGRAYLEDEQYANAVTHLERAHDRTEDPDLVLPLARALFGLERLSEIIDLPQPKALDDREAAELAGYRALAYLRAGEEEAARVQLDEGRRRAPDLALHSLVQAELAFRDGEADEASSAARKAIAADAELVPAWVLLGDLARWEGDNEAALEAYDRVLELRPNRIAERLKRGLVLLELERYKDAAKDADFVLRGASEHPGGHFLQGLIHFQREEPEAAQPYFEESLALHRDYRPVMPYLAAVHMEQENYAQAENLLQRHTALGEGTTMSYRLWAQVLMEQGKPTEARERLEDALQRHPEMTPVLGGMLAAIYLDSGQPERGIEFLRTSLSEGRDSPTMRRMLERALVEYEDESQAEAVIGQDASEEPEVRALAWLREGEYAKALDLAQEMISENPENAQGYNVQGAALLGLERLAEARLAFQEGLQKVPKSTSLAMNLGSLELRLGNRAAAREVLEDLQSIEPGHPGSAVRLAGMEMEANDHQAARAWLKTAIENYPEAVQPYLVLARSYLEEGEVEQAIRVLEQGRDERPESAELLFAIAEVHEREQRHEAAIETLRQAARQRPDVAEFSYRVARNYAALDEREKSIESLREAVRIDSNHQAARVALSRQLGLSDQLEAASEVLEPLLEGDDAAAPVLAQKAWLLALEGDFAEAVNVYDAALREQGRRDWMMERYRAAMQADEVSRAVEGLQQWLAERPGDQVARHLLASVQARLERTEEAVRNYRRLLEERPEDAVTLNNLAWLLREDATEEALEYAREAVRLAPEQRDVLDTLGVVLLYSNQPQEALTVFEDAYVDAASTPAIGFNLARARLAVGDVEGARAQLQAVLDEGGDFAERARAMSLLGELGP